VLKQEEDFRLYITEYFSHMHGFGRSMYKVLTDEASSRAASSIDTLSVLMFRANCLLFTLHVLFNHPASFRTFVASSPSIWWNKRSVLLDVTGFARQIEAGETTPRVLIMVGSSEQDVPDPLPPSMTSVLTKKMPFVPSAIRNLIARIVVKKMMLDFRMVDNARDVAALLQQIKGGPGYVVRFHTIEDEDHLTASSASIGPALAFALRP
jgi:hypothetical protein